MESIHTCVLFRLAIEVEKLITDKLQLVDFGSIIHKENGHFEVVNVKTPKVPGDILSSSHFCVTVGPNPKTNQPCIFLYNVVNRQLVNQLVPALIGKFGANIVFDLDDQEYSPELVQQIFEKRD